MNFEILNLTLSAKEAQECRAVQYLVSDFVEVFTTDISSIKNIACADVSYKDEYAFGVMLVMDFNTLDVKETVKVVSKIGFHYIPGFLAFRELPVIIDLINKSSEEFELFLVDGHGLAHPCRAGIATHLGVIIEKPTIGCAKSLLYGQYQEIPNNLGAKTEILDPKTGDIIGIAIRTKVNSAPVFVSVGNLITLQQSVDIVMRLSMNGKYRVPYPIFLADRITKEERKKHLM